MSNIRTRQLIVNDVRVLVRELGPSAHEEAVVFVHGSPGSSEDWTELLERTGAFARAIAADMPGYGQSERPRAYDYTVVGYAHCLGALLEQLGVLRAHLVLHDFGGPWGLHWAFEHLQQVASVTLIDVGLVPGYRWHKLARIWRTPVLGELFMQGATRSAFRAMLNADNPKPLPDAFVDRMWRDFDRGTRRAVLALHRATSDLGDMSERLGGLLAPLRLPALVLWGAADAYLPAKFAAQQQEYFDAEIHILDGCGHWPMVDDPVRVRELVLPFLRRQQGRTQRALAVEPSSAV